MIFDKDQYDPGREKEKKLKVTNMWFVEVFKLLFKDYLKYRNDNPPRI